MMTMGMTSRVILLVFMFLTLLPKFIFFKEITLYQVKTLIYKFNDKDRIGNIHR